MKGKHSGGEIVFKLDLKLKQSLTFIGGNFPEIFVNKERERKGIKIRVILYNFLDMSNSRKLGYSQHSKEQLLQVNKRSLKSNHTEKSSTNGGKEDENSNIDAE